MRMPLGFPPEAVRSGLSYAAQRGDIFVASYPKSGTTWLQYIVHLLVRREPLGPGQALTDSFPHLEEVGAEALASLPGPRLIKTHLPVSLTPYHEAARYLVIARNPFDCCVSFFHHTRGFPQHYDFAEGSFAEFLECFVAGEVDFGDYFDHLLGWHEARQRPNVMFLTYEGLRADTRSAIRRIAAFLGGSARAAVSGDAGLEAVIRESSLDSMRRDQQRWSSKRPDWAPAFVREGRVGGWSSLFEPEMARALLAEFDRRLEGSPLAGLWPDVLAAARDRARERN